MNKNNQFKIDDRKRIAEELSRVLIESYVLRIKALHFIWNSTEPISRPLHLAFEKQYKESGKAVSEIANRIRTLGFPAPGTFPEFQSLSPKLQDLNSMDITSGKPNALGMAKELLDDHKTISRMADGAAAIALKYGDEETANLMLRRVLDHDIKAEMLGSFLN
jgi:starvation-inducible DNA-binding protein